MNRVSPSNPRVALLNNCTGNDKNLPWRVFIRVLNRPMKQSQLIKWGEDIAALATKIDCSGEFDTFHGYCNNITPPENQPLLSYITIEDTFKVMEHRYRKPIKQLMKNPEIAQEYFDSHLLDDAKNLAQGREIKCQTAKLLDSLF